MKRKYNFKIAFTSFATIQLLFAQASLAQTTNYNRPVAQQYVGSTNQMGSVNYIAPTRQIHSQGSSINTVYAAPMQRVSEIPLYGKNKNIYFYDAKKTDTSAFSNSGLYLFGAFSTGSTSNGINSEKSIDDGVVIGSSHNDSMGDADGITVGFGRALSSNVSIELAYSTYSGMKYGDYTKYSETEEFCDDPEDPTTCYDIVNIVNGFEITSGGSIDSNTFMFGFQYKLDGILGNLFAGMLKPYIGGQFGMAMNKISDYDISDPNGYQDGDLMFEMDENGDDIATDLCTDPDNPCLQYDYTNGIVRYMGKTEKNFAYGLEVGFTFDAGDNLQLDFFYKRSMLGKVSTSSNVLSTYDETTIDFTESTTGDVAGCPTDYSFDGTFCVIYSDPISYQTMTKLRPESGDLDFNQFGIKLKYMF